MLSKEDLNRLGSYGCALATRDLPGTKYQSLGLRAAADTTRSGTLRTITRTKSPGAQVRIRPHAGTATRIVRNDGQRNRHRGRYGTSRRALRPRHFDQLQGEYSIKADSTAEGVPRDAARLYRRERIFINQKLPRNLQMLQLIKTDTRSTKSAKLRSVRVSTGPPMDARFRTNKMEGK